MVLRCVRKILAPVSYFAVLLLLLLVPKLALAADPPKAFLPGWTNVPGAQLPPGWSWPTLPSNPGGASTPGIPRPFDLGSLLSQTASCPPIEVAPKVFIPVPCTPGSAQHPKPSTRPPKYLPAGPLPAYVDLPKYGYDGPIKDQAQVGVCWAFALSTAAENALRRQGRHDFVSATHIIAARSEKRLYASGLNGTAIAPDSAWPYDPVRACYLNDVLGYRDPWCEAAYHVPSGSWRSQPQIVAELRNADAWGTFRIREEELSGNTDEIANLINQSRSVIADISIDSRAWGHSIASSGTIADYLHADRGGHAVVLVAYTWSNGERYFLIHNSWGTDWGKGGYAWIADRTLRRHILGASIVDVYARGFPVPSEGATSGT